MQNILTRKIEGYCQNIIIDKATLDNSMARPDISYCQTKKGEIQIGEFTVPKDTKLDEAYTAKQEKYQDWMLQMEIQEPDTNPHLAVFCIGALGTIHKDIKKEMKYFGIPASSARKIAINMAIEAMLETYKIWCSRCKENWQHRLPRRFRR